MKSPNRYTQCLALIGAMATTAAFAQISSINSGVITPRVFNDMPGATGTYLNSYPASITLGESGAYRTNSGPQLLGIFEQRLQPLHFVGRRSRVHGFL